MKSQASRNFPLETHAIAKTCLASLCALTLLGAPGARASLDLTYTDGQNDATSYDTSGSNNPANLTVTTGSATQSGALTGTGLVNKLGGGTLVLTAANSYSGGTVIDAGTLQVGNGTTGSINGPVTNNGVLAFGRSNGITFAGVISGTGSVAVLAGGNTTLSGSNSYSGGTSIIAGGLVPNNASALGSGTVTLVGGDLNGVNNVTLPNPISIGGNNRMITNFGSNAKTTFAGAIALNGNNLTIRATSGGTANTASTTVTGGVTGAGNLTLSLVGNATERPNIIVSTGMLNNTGTITSSGNGIGTVTISAVIGTNVAGLIQSGTNSTLILESVNTYSGATSVTAGILTLDDGTLGQGALTVGAAGKLSGNGTIPGNATVSGGLAPGLSVGTLVFDADLTLGASSVVSMELSSAISFDQVQVGGALAYGGDLQISFLGGYLPDSGAVFDLFDFTSQLGTFTGITFAELGYEGSMNYSTGELTITAVPEPSAFALAGAGLLGLLLVRRKRPAFRGRL